MAVKTFDIKFSNLAKEYSNRLDYDFLEFNIEKKKKNDYSFNKLFDFVDKEKVNIENLENFNYAEIGDVDKTGDVNYISLNFDNRNELNENYFSKIEKGDILKADLNDILISSVRPNLKKVVFIDREKSSIYFTKAFIHLRTKGISPMVLYYALRSIFLKNLISISRQGKAYPTLKDVDLKYLYFDKNVIKKLKSIQNQLQIKIKPIENRIKILKKEIKDPIGIINKVFANEFGLNLEKLNKIYEQNILTVNFSNLSNYHSLRSDFKFQKNIPVFNKIISQMDDFIYLNNITLNEPLYGANEEGVDGIENEDIRYIRITDIDGAGGLKNEEWKTAKTIEDKYILKDLDFLFARSGNTVGKTFLYEKDKHPEALFAGYFIKFKLDFSKILPKFLLFYTKSFIFSFWKNGIIRIKGQPNINAEEYLELKIPLLALSRQQKIVNKIKPELDKQEITIKKIEKEREKIDGIISTCIK